MQRIEPEGFGLIRGRYPYLGLSSVRSSWSERFRSDQNSSSDLHFQLKRIGHHEDSYAGRLEEEALKKLETVKETRAKDEKAWDRWLHVLKALENGGKEPEKVRHEVQELPMSSSSPSPFFSSSGGKVESSQSLGPTKLEVFDEGAVVAFTSAGGISTRETRRRKSTEIASVGLDSIYLSGIREAKGWKRKSFDLERLPIAPQNVSQLSCGGGHLVWTTVEGACYSVGDNAHGQLGRSNASGWFPGQVPFGTGTADCQIVSVACGEAHTLFVAQRQGVPRVYACGSNVYHQLGVREARDLMSPVEVGGLRDIRSVYAGPQYSLAVSNRGLLYAWGRSDFNQLGFGHSIPNRTTGDCQEVPAQVPLPFGVVASHVSCRPNGVLLLTTAYIVYSWGTNQNGILGHPQRLTENRRLDATLIRPLGRSTCVSMGGGPDHVVIALKGGTVYSWGNNEHGQCGVPSRSGIIWEPIQVTGISGVKVVYVFESYSQFTIVLSDDGALYTFGFGWHGQLGTGHSAMRTMAVPHHVTAPVRSGRFTLAGGGNRFSAFVVRPADADPE